MMVTLPILIPFVTIIIIFLCRRNTNAKKLVALLSTFVLLGVSIFLYIEVREQGIIVHYIGGWEAPVGISLVVDKLSAIMLVITATIMSCTHIYSWKALDKNFHQSLFLVFFFGLFMGINGIFVTGDIFNMYVWFEVMLMASFVLIVLGHRPFQLEGGLKYLVISLVSSLLFLTAIGLLYGYMGTLHLAQLSSALRGTEFPASVYLSLVLLIISFGIKAAIFPFFFWLPASYHTPPVAISGMFAGLLTKVGIYAMIRIITLLFDGTDPLWHTVLLVIAGLTMVIGAICALAQNDIRKILSFSIISQMGYLVFGLAIYSPLSIGATIYFMVHSALVKSNLFFLIGIIGRNSKSYDLNYLNGGISRYPVVSALFFISLLAISGIPPLSGFFGKLMIVRAAIEGHYFWLATIAIGTSLLTLAYMLKIWISVFWRNADRAHKQPYYVWPSMIFPCIILTLAIVLMGVGSGKVFEWVDQAAIDLIDPEHYIRSVLDVKKLDYENF